MERNRGGRPRHPDILTPAEWRVLEELRLGGTNAEIAVRLGISPDTVKYHIANMLAKLEVGDRRKLAAWQRETRPRSLRRLLAAPAVLGPVVRPVAWVALGATALGAVAVVAVLLVALGGNGDDPLPVAPPPTDPPASSPSPTQPPPPTATTTAQPPATATATPEPTPDPTPPPAPAPVATELPDSTALPDQPDPDPSRYGAFGLGPPETLTTVLQPGLNLAGWTEPDADVAVIFDAIPALTYLYAWDAEAQWFRWATRSESGVAGDLTTLLPGMGLWLDLGGSEPFSWTRPLIPQTGLADLREGWNLIVWAGHDGTASTEALKHLDGIVAATLDGDGVGPATLPRGGAFWLQASAPRQWWQLDDPPRVEFVSDHSPAEQETLHGWVDDVVAYYARRFGHGVPGLVIRFGDDAVFGDGEDAPCGRYVRPVISLQTRCPAILAHEYAHAVQRYLAPSGSHGPLWLTEGVAERWFGQYVEAGGAWNYARHVRETVVPRAQTLSDPLQTLEEQGRVRGPLSYSVAELAAAWLASLAGEDAIYGYYARRAEHASWEDAFRAAFGLTIADFYEGFETFRSAGAPPLSLVSGTVLGADGKPAAGISVNFGNALEGRPRATKTDARGNFALSVRQRSFVFTLRVDQCSLRWSSSDTRIHPVPGAGGRINTEAGAVEGLVLTLLDPPSVQCGLIEGSVTDLAGNPRAAVGIIAFPTSRSLAEDDRVENVFAQFSTLLDSNGKFSMIVPRLRYTIAVWTAGRLAGSFGGDAGFTTRHGEATVLDLRVSDFTDIEIHFGVVSGTLLGSDGEPIEGVYVLEPNHQTDRRSGIIPLVGMPKTDSNGTFRLVLPRGAHTLELECLRGGGGWYGGVRGYTNLEWEATPITVDGSDVNRIVINVPFTQAEVDASAPSCPAKELDVPLIKGVVLGSDGEPRTGLRLRLSDTDMAHVRGNTRDVVRTVTDFRMEMLSSSDYLYIFLHAETHCPSDTFAGGEWVELGRAWEDGRFTPASDLPEGMSVEESDIQSVVVRLPATCP